MCGGDRTRGKWGVGLGPRRGRTRDRTKDWTGGRTNEVGRGGQTGGVRLGGSNRGGDWTEDRTRWLVKISQVSLRFADMSSNMDVVHPTCPSLGKINFDLDKVTSGSVTVTVEAVTTS